MKKTCCFLVVISTAYCSFIKQEACDDVIKIAQKTRLTFLDTCPTINPSDVEFQLYDRENSDVPIILTRDQYDLINLSRETKIVVHGWLGFPNAAIAIKHAYLTKDDYNVIFIGWVSPAAESYASAYCSVPQIGKVVANFIYDAHFDLDKIHLIGDSIGAHLSGFVGKEIQTLTSGQKVKRITGVDASGPLYSNPPSTPNKRLNADDAHFVDAIHADDIIGYAYPYGTVDFYVNGGKLQPGCPTVNVSAEITNFDDILDAVRCSHGRAFKYFTESVNSDGFVATAPNSICLSSSCTQLTVIMGENCPSNVTGVYTVTTRSEPPYAI